jgi:hypothetical protein
METTMNKTNDASCGATSEHHDTIGDPELDAVTGGTKCTGGSASGPVTLRQLAQVLGELEQAQFNNVR